MNLGIWELGNYEFNIEKLRNYLIRNFAILFIRKENGK